MNVFVILAFFLAAMAHAQQEQQQQQPSRQRRAHLSLRQDQQQQQPEQGGASPLLTEMMEIDSEVSCSLLSLETARGPVACILSLTRLRTTT
jgi:hypothetical protein